MAYIRFASVYREFDSLENFIEEVRKLDTRSNRKGKKVVEEPLDEDEVNLEDEAKMGTV